MSEQETLDIAELAQLDRDLGAATRTKPAVQLVNNSPEPTEFSHWQVGMIEAYRTADSHPHLDMIRERLRTMAKDLNADPQDRAAAAEALRVMYRE
jgi:hypothetical protein